MIYLYLIQYSNMFKVKKDFNAHVRGHQIVEIAATCVANVLCPQSMLNKAKCLACLCLYTGIFVAHLDVIQYN